MEEVKDKRRETSLGVTRSNQAKGSLNKNSTGVIGTKWLE